MFHMEIDSEFVVEFRQELLGPSQFRRVARRSVKKDVSGSSNRISITLATTCLGQVVILKHQNSMTQMSGLQLAKRGFLLGVYFKKTHDCQQYLRDFFNDFFYKTKNASDFSDPGSDSPTMMRSSLLLRGQIYGTISSGTQLPTKLIVAILT